MTRDKFQLFHEAMTRRGRQICKEKSADYAKDSDVYHNFELGEYLGIGTTAQGFMFRLSDKLSRLSNLIEDTPQVKDETIVDTVVDAMNYLILLGGYLVTKKGKDVDWWPNDDDQMPALASPPTTTRPGSAAKPIPSPLDASDETWEEYLERSFDFPMVGLEDLELSEKGIEDIENQCPCNKETCKDEGVCGKKA